MSPVRPRRPRLPASRPRIFFGATLAPLVLLAACQTCPTVQPPPPLPVRAPCVEQVPEVPALLMERLPVDAAAVEVLRAALVDRERLIAFGAEAAVLLAGCAR